ncbi:MAG TPA: APC family permease [Alphaproteobacteria bacterium]|nr:APC family permease [Alphaproteobacteria bacterium]
MPSSRKLTLLPLAAATYFMVSGGPYGLEELVQTSGYKMGLLILFVVPLIWSLPTGLMVGELSAAIPSEGGFYVWVRRALGPFWGFQEAWLSLVASVFDMAIYPTLFALYLGHLWPAAVEGERKFLVAGLVVAACLVWNLFGAKSVGQGSVLMGALLLSPFVVISVVALFRHSGFTLETTHAAVKNDLLAGMLVAMWNYMGWDNASPIAAEVDNPQKTYPRVMLLTLAAIMLSYILPVAAVWRTGIPPEAWETSNWASIASTVVGPWLGIALVVAAMISEVGSFNSLVMSYSRLPVAMAQDRLLPQVFTRKLKNGAPWVAILVCGLGWAASLRLNFERLLVLDILLWGASVVLEFLALVVLRMREPELPRPFRVPGGTLGAVLAGVGPTVLVIVALIQGRGQRVGSMSALTLGFILMAAGVALYFVARISRKNFVGSTPQAQ